MDTQTPKRRGPFLPVAWCLLVVVCPTSFILAADVAVQGRIERIGPFRVLRVWGTPEEMGYAHGYLIGKEFVAGLKAQIAAQSADQRTRYDTMRQPLMSALDIPPSALDELRGIYRGIEAVNGKAPDLELLHRPLRLTDLILFNAGDMTRAFACSGFTAWGDRAGKMGVITARNFDFYLLYPDAMKDQLILVRQPDQGHQVATVTWPGYIGAFTGISDAGVCAFMHDGTGPMMHKPSGKKQPIALVTKQMLETSTARDALDNMERLLKSATPYPFSYLVRIVTPRVPAAGYKPVRVFRVDAAGLSENPVGDSTCITTNHYLEPTLTPAANAGNGSLKRYAILKQRMTATITPQQAWEALRAVAVSDHNQGTLHSLVVYPEQRRLDLAFAHSGEWKVTAATRSEPTRIEFAKLFARHP